MAAQLDNAEILQERLAGIARLAIGGELASGMAHEINQPLAAITAYAGVLKRTAAATPESALQARKIATEIADQAMRAGEMIHRICSIFSHGNFDFCPTSCNDVVDDLMPLALPLVRAQGIDLVVHLAPSLPAVRADRLQLQILLVNLLQNAIQAIAAAAPAVKTITVETKSLPDGGIELAVEDTGGGIAGDMVARLFQPFQTTKAGGTGLGLLACQRIATAHGGNLRVDNRPGCGVRFALGLPGDAV